VKRRVLALLVFCTLAACRTQTLTVDAKQHERTNAESRLSLKSETGSHDMTEQTLRRLVNSRYKVSIKRIIYDTDRPADSLTGRSPIAEEIDIVMNVDTETVENDSIFSESHVRRVIDLNDISVATAEVRTEVTGTKKTGPDVLRKTFACAGVILIIAIIATIVLKVKRWI
jgi:hypothetical protein